MTFILKNQYVCACVCVCICVCVDRYSIKFFVLRYSSIYSSPRLCAEKVNVLWGAHLSEGARGSMMDRATEPWGLPSDPCLRMGVQEGDRGGGVG